MLEMQLRGYLKCDIQQMIRVETRGRVADVRAKLSAKYAKHLFRPDGDQGNVRTAFLRAEFQLGELHNVDQC